MAIGNLIQGRVQLLQLPGERLVHLEGGPNRDQHGQVSRIHARVQKLPNGSLAPLRRVQVHGLEIQQENDIAALTPLLNVPERTGRARRRLSRLFMENLSLFQPEQPDLLALPVLQNFDFILTDIGDEPALAIRRHKVDQHQFRFGAKSGDRVLLPLGLRPSRSPLEQARDEQMRHEWKAGIPANALHAVGSQ